MTMQLDFMSHNEDKVLWVYDYETKTFVHKDTGEKFPFTFDPDNGIFVTAKGVSIVINPMSKFTLAEFQHNYRIKHEPLPPQIKVKIDENTYTDETNANDKHWQLEYGRFTETASMELLKFLITFSTEVIVPNDRIDRLSKMARAMGEDTDSQEFEDNIAYVYVRDSIGDEQELYAFFDVLLGRNLITKGALERSEERFQDESSGS